MSKELSKIDSFLSEHHVLSLATSGSEILSVCNLFYIFCKEANSFIVASSEDTLHIQHIKKNKKIAGSVVLETKTVGKIQGVQFRGEVILLENTELKKLYFCAFPYALAMNPILWQIKVDFFKMTDNRLGFGKKIVWRVNESGLINS